MKINSSYAVPLSAERLWQAITDPEILKACLNSCYEVNRLDHGEYIALFHIKIGPVQNHYSAKLKIIDSNTIEKYKLQVSVKSDDQVTAEAKADVRLESMDEDNARINYSAEIVVYGPLAKIGALVIKPFAKKQIGYFFDRISEQVTKGR